MKNLKKSIPFLLFIILLARPAICQQSDQPVLKNKDVEIGIVEHLGDTIPMDLWFFNEKNDTVTLRQLINKPTIMCLVYFDCPNLCSPLMDGIAETVSKLDLTLGKDYQIITISFNTKDTPEKAAEKKKNFVQKIAQENQNAWIYLTGTQENIDKITDAIGFRYVAQGLDFAHASAIYVISPHGMITRYLYGLTFLPFDVKMAIIEAQKGIPRPTINKILEYCFAYNPGSKTYTLQITRIMGAFIIFVLLIVFLVLILRKRKKR